MVMAVDCRRGPYQGPEDDEAAGVGHVDDEHDGHVDEDESSEDVGSGGEVDQRRRRRPAGEGRGSGRRGRGE